MKIYPYNPGSKSARALAEALGIKRIKHEGPPLNIRETVINWGASNIRRPLPNVENVFNPPEAVKKASNKLSTLKILSGEGVCVPDWTEDRQEAIKWLGEGHTVFARTKLNGHSGEGIVVATPGEEQAFVDAPLYTKYVPKKHEYRIHVFRDEAFFVQGKARKAEVPDDEVNWKIRNLAGGFIFAHKDVEIADVAKHEAIIAVKALGLDFGAVDIIWNQKENKYYVLEVNTACGLEGTTLEKYCEQFRKFI